MDNVWALTLEAHGANGGSGPMDRALEVHFTNRYRTHVVPELTHRKSVPEPVVESGGAQHVMRRDGFCAAAAAD